MDSNQGEKISGRIERLENDPDWEERWAQGEFIWEEYPEMVEPLLDRLDVGDTQTRERAVTALGWIRDERAVDSLITVLRRDEDEEVRKEAATALGSIGCDDAYASLLDVFEAESSLHLRCRIITALGGIGATEDVIQIAREYEGGDAADVRQHSISVLGMYCDETAITALVQFIDQGTSAERRKAAASLDICGTARAFEKLVELLDDDDAEVRSWAAQGVDTYLSRHRDDYDATGVANSVRRLLGLPSSDNPLSHVVESLLNLLNDQNVLVRRQAASALGTIGRADLLKGYRRRVRNVLIDTREHDESEEVRNAAEVALSGF